MEKPREYLYNKDYLAGYRDGIRDAVSGKSTKMMQNDILDLPIKVMALSTRARNCLSHAGCTYIADVIALSEDTIMAMRNLGSKTASEIALWLNANGIYNSAWSDFLR